MIAPWGIVDVLEANSGIHWCHLLDWSLGYTMTASLHSTRNFEIVWKRRIGGGNMYGILLFQE